MVPFPSPRGERKATAHNQTTPIQNPQKEEEGRRGEERREKTTQSFRQKQEQEPTTFSSPPSPGPIKSDSLPPDPDTSEFLVSPCSIAPSRREICLFSREKIRPWSAAWGLGRRGAPLRGFLGGHGRGGARQGVRLANAARGQTQPAPAQCQE